MTIVAESEIAPDFAEFGIRAFTTTRAVGSFGLHTDEPVRDVMSRWTELQRELRPAGARLATARQVHGADLLIR